MSVHFLICFTAILLVASEPLDVSCPATNVGHVLLQRQLDASTGRSHDLSIDVRQASRRRSQPRRRRRRHRRSTPDARRRQSSSTPRRRRSVSWVPRAPIPPEFWFPAVAAGKEEILGEYFDIAAGSVGGTWVSGRLNPKSNRLSGGLPGWSFVLTDDGQGRFEVLNQRDSEKRLYGALRLQQGQETGAAGSVHRLVAELHADDGALMGSLAFDVRVVEETVLAAIKSKVLEFASGKCGYRCYENTGSTSWEKGVNNIGKLGKRIADASLAQATGERQILSQCKSLAASVSTKIDDPSSKMPGEGFADTELSGLSHSQVTHQWRFTDALILPGIYAAENAFLSALSTNSYSAGLEALIKLLSVHFAVTPKRRRLGTWERWGNLLDLTHSGGVWSDANLGHRSSTWIAMLWVWQDYNRPATYLPYWYSDFNFSSFLVGTATTADLPPGFSFMPSWHNARGVFADVRDIMSGAYYKSRNMNLSGFGPDGFIAHHTGYCRDTAMTAYGFEWLSDPLRVAHILHNTPWKLEPEWVTTAARYLIYTYPRIVYKGQVDWLFAGRNYYSEGNWRWRTTHLLPTIRILLDDLRSGLSQQMIQSLNALAAGGDGPDTFGNTAFWNSDTMVHRKHGFYMSLRMRSVRTTGNEDFESTGRSWHSGSGVFLTKVHGDEYDMVRSHMDWHLLPGITEEWRTDSLPKKGNRCGGNVFASAASDGVFGVAAFVNQPAVSDPYSSVFARKTWFFLDSKAVMLGNSIARAVVGGETRFGTHPVVTVIEQSLWRSEVQLQVGQSEIKTYAFGERCKADVTIPPGELAWLHQGSVGYVIMNPSSSSQQSLLQLRCGREVRATGSENWNKEAERQQTETGMYFGSHLPFLAVLSHGDQPTDASYTYMTLPGTTAAEVAAQAAAISTSSIVLRNDAAVQAVSDSASTVQATFFQAASLTLPFEADGEPVSMTINQAAVIQIRRFSDRWSLAVAEGTHNLTTQSLTLSFDKTGLFEVGSYDYTLPGVQPRPAVDKIFVDEAGSSSTVRFDLPDISDDASYEYQGEMYVGAPIHILIPVASGVAGSPVSSSEAPSLTASATTSAPCPEGAEIADLRAELHDISRRLKDLAK
eukprot:TRINITY_DN29567_c0_g1_i1.p1 TRINITY_DN29567_c0_g1~~TRINITY_DN29567_c0_g1_i1.p1  ORF type:complete len:1108 (-),score=127.04 TRINITY_DN29567_c0_g1_i1:18-3341(-)